MDNFLSALQGIGILIGGLSLLVLIHELGHFIPAKLFGMRVDKFYLFFDWPRKLWSFQYKGTEYGIGLLPLGGYVKIAGMIDESLDTDSIKKEPEPWEFRAKPVWQRMIVMVGGVTMNVILAIAILTVTKQQVGDTRIPFSELKRGIYVPEDSWANEIGLKTGYVFLDFKGQQPEFVEDVASASVFIESDAWYTIERQGQRLRIDIPNDFVNNLTEQKRKTPVLFVPRQRTTIKPAEEGPAAKMRSRDGRSLAEGDRIVQVDDAPIEYYDELRAALKSRAGKDIRLLAVRGTNDTLQFTPHLDESAILGVYVVDSLAVVRQTYSFFEAIPPATAAALRIVSDNLKGFGKLFSGDIEVSKGLDGPVGIGKQYYKTVENAGWYGFWMLTAMLSMVLAFMNILPIPALDGGHLLLLAVEALKRRPLSTALTLRIQQVGMVFLLGLMAFVLFNDFFKLFVA